MLAHDDDVNGLAVSRADLIVLHLDRLEDLHELHGEHVRDVHDAHAPRSRGNQGIGPRCGRIGPKRDARRCSERRLERSGADVRHQESRRGRRGLLGDVVDRQAVAAVSHKGVVPADLDVVGMVLVLDGHHRAPRGVVLEGVGKRQWQEQRAADGALARLHSADLHATNSQAGAAGPCHVIHRVVDHVRGVRRRVDGHPVHDLGILVLKRIRHEMDRIGRIAEGVRDTPGRDAVRPVRHVHIGIRRRDPCGMADGDGLRRRAVGCRADLVRGREVDRHGITVRHQLRPKVHNVDEVEAARSRALEDVHVPRCGDIHRVHQQQPVAMAVELRGHEQARRLVHPGGHGFVVQRVVGRHVVGLHEFIVRPVVARDAIRVVIVGRLRPPPALFRR